VLDKAEYSAFKSTLNSAIVLYCIVCAVKKLLTHELYCVIIVVIFDRMITDVLTASCVYHNDRRVVMLCSAGSTTVLDYGCG